MKSRKMCSKCRGRRARERGRECIESKSREMAIKARARSVKKNLTCEIDALWIVTRWYAQHGRCHFSGRPMTLEPGPLCVSLDRLNSDKGYTRRNTVLAAMRVNGMKSDMSVDEFLGWCESVTHREQAHAQEVGGHSGRQPRRKRGASSPY